MKVLSFLLLIVLFSTNLQGQVDPSSFKYRRSSLSMILLESSSFPQKDAVMNSWQNYPFPDKYNKHDINMPSVSIENITLTDDEYRAAGYLDTLKKITDILKATASLNNLRYNADSTVILRLPTEKVETQLRIDKIIREQGLAKKCVSSWFNRTADGKLSFDLVASRGMYSASEMDKAVADNSSVGMSAIADAGIELLKNTFVTFTKMDFVENEPIVRAIRDQAILEIQKNITIPIAQQKAIELANKAYEKAKEGYSLWSKTWLYQLNWNDSIQSVMFQQLWNDPKAYESSDLFSLNFVGVQYNTSLVTFSLKETRTQEQIINLALVRNVDKAFAELQKDNDVFKPKVPVLTSDPITAQIGMKEGLEGGEKFDVFEMTMNPKTGLTEYKNVGQVSVDKKLVWDNRYTDGQVVTDPESGEEENAAAKLNATTFKGSKKIQPGMLLKQIK
jgi:hypothetical protein